MSYYYNPRREEEDEYRRWRQHGHERGFFDRARDEIASWFGDDDAERRREMDRLQQHSQRVRPEDYGEQGARQFHRDWAGAGDGMSHRDYWGTYGGAFRDDEYNRLPQQGGSRYEYRQEWNRPYGEQYGSQTFGHQGPINRWTLGGTEWGDYGTRPSHRGRGPRNFKRNDERIREEVIETLTQHHELDATDVEIDVKDGEVILRGMVESRWDKRLAEDITEDVFGVRNVQNQLKVRQSMNILGQTMPGQESTEGQPGMKGVAGKGGNNR